jgi:uncharacterized membrane protein YphA (DoxX/SURF4 family)
MQLELPFDESDADALDTALDEVHRRFGTSAVTLRIFTGLVWLSNALAKVFEVRGPTTGASCRSLSPPAPRRKRPRPTPRPRPTSHPLGAFYRDVVLPHWGFFGTFLTVAEPAIGLGLIFGVVTRLAAVGGCCCSPRSG